MITYTPFEDKERMEDVRNKLNTVIQQLVDKVNELEQRIQNSSRQ